ncbi:MAG: GDP-mannose 4,6-dehydratase, partial [Anaerolineaceae bacterium]|nr:GDP-mannose 4,6-dehydratase [Anaerolineaceae bacterium]
FVRQNSRGDAGFLNQPAPEVASQLEIVAGDLKDNDAVRGAVRGMDYVFHLGALISIPYSYHHPRDVAETNVMGTVNVLMACREYGIERLIHTSTSEVYGSALYVPIDEHHPLQGQSPYSASKIGADKLVQSFHCAFSLPAVTVRPFNTFGPRQSARAVIPSIINQALSRDVIYMGNLDTTRDFTYVSDTVNGFIKAAEAPETVLGDEFNLGTGVDISIGDLANEIIRQINPKIRIEIDPKRLRPAKSEVTRLLSNNQKAREHLNWQPLVTFSQGIEKTIMWIREHLELYNPDIYSF